MRTELMSRLKVTAETFQSLERCRQRGDGGLLWPCLFSLPPWMAAWWDCFGSGKSLWLRAFWEEEELIGVAPLMVSGNIAELVGSADICDFLDVAARPDEIDRFFPVLLDYLRREGVDELRLNPVRGDAMAIKGLDAMGPTRDLQIEREKEGITFEMKLPSDWNDFLHSLGGKERHEIRRKYRRLDEAGHIRFTRPQDSGSGAVETAMDRFFKLFRANRPDKTAFMTSRMERYFRTLAAFTAKAGLLKLFFLEIDAVPVATTLCFDYRGTRHLYNNGYDSRYRRLSVGVLSKVSSIQNAIESGCRQYDFLKGAETYKQHLGGRPSDLYRIRIRLRTSEG